MVRVFAAALDVLLITMLVSFTVDGRERRDFPRKRWYKMAVGAWLLLVASLVLFENSDAPYMLIMMGYMIGCIVVLTTQKRLRTLVATLFMVLIAGFPLNIFIFLFNVMGIDIVFGYGDALYALASLMSAVVIFWVWRQRRKFGDELAIRFSVPECLMIVLLFILTMILGLVMNPETGELSQAVLESGSGDFLVATVTALVVFLNVFFLVMVWRNKTTTYYRRLNALNSQFVNSELHYFESYKEAQEDIRTFRHDMKHHMARMAGRSRRYQSAAGVPGTVSAGMAGDSLSFLSDRQRPRGCLVKRPHGTISQGPDRCDDRRRLHDIAGPLTI